MAEDIVIDSHAQDILFREARTANTFTDDPVSPAQVRAIWDLVKWAPTSMNCQPLRMVMVASPEARARLVPLMSPGNQPKTATAPMTVILAADVDFHEHLPAVFANNPTAKDGFGDPAARERFALGQAWLQAGYFILGIRAAGLAAGPMGGFDQAAVNAEFLADRPWKSFLVVNLGKPGPDAWFARNPRLAEEIVIVEH